VKSTALYNAMRIWYAINCKVLLEILSVDFANEALRQTAGLPLVSPVEALYYALHFPKALCITAFVVDTLIVQILSY
jgi:hypothetical protein